MSRFTQREFLYLEDALASAEHAVKCFQMLAAHCQLPQARQVCQNAAQMHQAHFQRLLRHLQNAQGKSAGMEYQQQLPGNAYAAPMQNWGAQRGI